MLHGSRKWFEGDKWISTTRSLQRAKEIQAEFGGRIVKIDLKKAGNSIDDVIDLTDDAARAAHLKGWRANNYATKNLEVLLEGIVPPEAITPLF